MRIKYKLIIGLLAFTIPTVVACVKHTETPEVQAHIEYANGSKLQDLGSLQKAGNAYSKAISLDPSFAAAYVGRGYVYLAHQNLASALRDFDKAIDLDPNLSEAYNYRGLVSIGLSDPEQAMLDFTKAIEINPRFADTYINRARLYFHQRDLYSAIEDMTMAIREEPGKPQYYMERAQIHLFNQDISAATIDLEQVLSLTKDPEVELEVKRQLTRIGTLNWKKHNSPLQKIWTSSLKLQYIQASISPTGSQHQFK